MMVMHNCGDVDYCDHCTISDLRARLAESERKFAVARAQISDLLPEVDGLTSMNTQLGRELARAEKERDEMREIADVHLKDVVHYLAEFDRARMAVRQLRTELDRERAEGRRLRRLVDRLVSLYDSDEGYGDSFAVAIEETRRALSAPEPTPPFGRLPSDVSEAPPADPQREAPLRCRGCKDSPCDKCPDTAWCKCSRCGGADCTPVAPAAKKETP